MGDDERRRASKLGAFEFITKPVDFERLKAQLRQLPTDADTYRGSEGQKSTHLSRPGARKPMAGMGQEEPFPEQRLSGSCGFG